MVTDDVVRYHLSEALRAGMAEISGNRELARHLRAETKMRLISMSEEELWELARVSCPPHKTFEQVYVSLKETVDELKSSDEWMTDLESYENKPGGRR